MEKKTNTTIKGRPKGQVKTDPAIYKNRFQKFFYAHRERLAEERRQRYHARLTSGVCVRCGKARMKGSNLFCAKHRPAKKAVFEKILRL